MLIIAVAVALAAWSLSAWATGPDPTPRAATPLRLPVAAPSSTVSSTAVPDRSVTTLATATVAEVTVFAERPSLAGEAPSLSLRSPRAVAYSPERAGSPAIPTEKDGVAGRYKIPEGWAISNPTSLGAPATFVVTETAGEWIRVLVPVRPNGTEGWVNLAQVQLTTTSLRIDVNVTTRSVTLFDRATELFAAPVIVGKPATSTPTGRCYVTDTIDKRVGGAYGSGILSTSCFSQALDAFDGGVPVIALHGTNRPDLLGQAASNGCIRMGEPAITRLRSTVPIGTPVDVHT